jgi:hypothetical protein
MTDQEKIEHKLNNISSALTGLYKIDEERQTELKQILDVISELKDSVKDLATKVDGDEDLDVTGLRKRVMYLETRDKWLKNKWMYAVGAIGGISLVYGAFKIIDSLFEFYKSITH